MRDTKIYAVLTHFDKIEQNRLRKYIRSPYFNVNETLMDFFDVLIQDINKNGKAGDLEKVAVWKKLYPKEAYNDVRFRKLGSDLLSLVEDFLAQQIFDNNDLHQAAYLMEAVTLKKIEKLYSSAHRRAKLTTEQQSLKPANFYYYQYLIEKNYYDLAETELNRSEKGNAEEIINNLDYFYLAEKLKWYTSTLSRKSLFSHEYHLLFIDEIINHVKKYQYEDVPAISVYLQSLLVQTEKEDENHYHDLVKILEDKGQLLPQKDLYDLYFAALNYCISKVNQGKNEFLEEYLNIVKYLLKTEIIFSENNRGELNPWQFKNIVLTGLRLGEYEWTESFINQYSNKLPLEFRDNAISYNLALVYFYQKKYDKVISMLQSIEYEDIAYNLGSKSMLIAIYYELDEDEALDFLIESFKAFLNRHKDIADNKRVPYLNLIKYVRKLRRLAIGDAKEIEKIKQEIEEDKKDGITSLRWILEKLAELE